MLIITAVNITGHGVLQDKKGKAVYSVEVAINSNPPIFKGVVKGHTRAAGASALLRLIADNMDKKESKN